MRVGEGMATCPFDSTSQKACDRAQSRVESKGMATGRCRVMLQEQNEFSDEDEDNRGCLGRTSDSEPLRAFRNGLCCAPRAATTGHALCTLFMRTTIPSGEQHYCSSNSPLLDSTAAPCNDKTAATMRLPGTSDAQPRESSAPL